MNNISWRLIKSFLITAKFGSLSAAAHNSGVSQPTISRDILQLEKQTGLSLFERTTKGLSLTEHGQNLLSSAQGMDKFANQFERVAFGLADELAGDLRVSANENIGYFILPSLIKKFRDRYPQIAVDLVIDNKESNLNKREADIALRMFRPSQADLYVKKLMNIPLSFYATQEYLDKHKSPENIQDLLNHTLIGFDQNMMLVSSAVGENMGVSREDFFLRTDSLLSQIALIRSGAGIGVTHKMVAQRYPELIQVIPQLTLPALELWSVCHRDIQQNNRIKAFMRFLSDELTSY